MIYVVKVMHGYIGKDGRRTREKHLEKLMTFKDRQQSEAFANKIGGRVKAATEIKV